MNNKDLRTPAKVILFTILSIPFCLIFPKMPVTMLWLIGYITVMFFIFKFNFNHLEQGALVIYFGAAIAVLGKYYILNFLMESLAAGEDVNVIETFFQIILMASSGLGGGLISHYVISKPGSKTK